jgi:membrane associated rhomboid family serine protease
MIIVIQVAFDLSTPQVSMAAHLCGLIAGFFLGLLLAPRGVAGVRDPACAKARNDRSPTPSG